MACIRKDYRYKLIKNFLNEEELNLLQKYVINKLDKLSSANIFNNDFSVAPYCLDYKNDDFMEVILKSKLSLIEKETELKLYPTYAYWRWYPYGAVLKAHRDRPSCEISVTVNIYKTKNWPMVINNKKIEIEPGEGLIYLGIEDKHSRFGFNKGEALAQLFLHYVDKNGLFPHHKNDEILKTTNQVFNFEDKELINILRSKRK